MLAEPKGIQVVVDLVDVSSLRVGEVLWIQGVDSVVRESSTVVRNDGVVDVPLTEVHETDNVSGIIGNVGSVGDPDFNLGDLDSRSDDRELLKPLVVILVEVLTQEEVSVGLVLINSDFEFLGTSTALHINSAGLTLLFGKYSSNGGFSESSLRLNPEEALGPRNERGVQGQTNISDFESLDDFIFIPGVLEFHLVFEAEGGLGIVVRCDAQFVSDGTGDVHLDALVKIEASGTAISFGKSGVICSVDHGPKNQRSRPTGSDIYSVPSKESIEVFTANLELREETPGFFKPASETAVPALTRLIVPVFIVLLTENVVLIFFGG